MKVSEKVDMRTHVPKKRFTVKPSFPNDMKIELTSRCNLKCKWCATKDKKRQQGDMDEKTIKILLDACKYLKVKEVGLFLLGESFLLKRLPEYIKYAKSIGIEYVYLTTNGTLCNKKNMRAVMDAGLDSLKFSLNAGTKKTYKMMTGKNYFNKVMKNIEWISKNRNDKIKLSVSCIYNENYKKELYELKNKILYLIEDFYFLPYYNQGGHINHGKNGNIGRLENPIDNIPCWELFNTVRITWDGYMSYCCFPHTDNFKIGSIKGLTLMNLWHHENFVNLRKQHLCKDIKNTICSGCLNGNGNH